MIRDRAAGDVDECLTVLAAVHAADGYPMHWPADPYRWLNPNGLRQAWVAIGRLSDGAEGIVGHVLVRDHRHGGDPSAAELGRLFQPFAQLGQARVRDTDGHGLGLASVRAIATAHGAALAPRARPDGGLDIDVTFPAR